MSFQTVLLCLFCFMFGFLTLSNSLQCIGQNNEKVDWFVIYKLPKKESHSNSLVSKGLAYVYMTSGNYGGWTLSNLGIDNDKSMVANTLKEFFDIKKNSVNILYNDQPPYGNNAESRGHTKGIVLANENEGFWLIHSVPHFPKSLDSYVYPKTGVHYGQSFLCVSMDLENLNKVGLQLQYNEPHIFAQNFPQNLKTSLPELMKAAQNITVKKAPWYNVENIQSKSGTKFVSFAKSGKFQKDLYSDLVASQLESDLYVETWPNEPNRLPSECDKKFQVDNVLSISVVEANISFSSTVDHSKWAVSVATEKWICIGDINRAERQTLRGGGTTCLNNDRLATDYQKIVSSVQNCNQNDL